MRVLRGQTAGGRMMGGPRTSARHSPTGGFASARSSSTRGPMSCGSTAGGFVYHDQPIQILRALLNRPGDVVAREALRERLWSADSFVDFDRGLNSAVRRLRRTRSATPRIARSSSKRCPSLGYRFIGEQY